MTYKVKEIFYTLQGEGTHAGRPAVFCRFSSCNLWTGREDDRERAICKFCDTDFVGTDGQGGGKFADAEALAEAVAAKWPMNGGGRPHGRLHGRRAAAAAGRAAVAALHARGFYVAVETNGTQSRRRPASTGSVSAPRSAPSSSSTRGTNSSSSTRRAASTRRRSSTWTSRASACSPWTARTSVANTELAVKYCLDHPQWQLSLQTHKYLGIP